MSSCIQTTHVLVTTALLTVARILHFFLQEIREVTLRTANNSIFYVNVADILGITVFVHVRIQPLAIGVRDLLNINDISTSL